MPFYKLGYDAHGSTEEWYLECDSLEEARETALAELMDGVGSWAEECSKEEWEENDGE